MGQLLPDSNLNFVHHSFEGVGGYRYNHVTKSSERKHLSMVVT